jgi:hypothetical protein
MPAAEIEHCAGPPRAAIPGPAGAVLVYRDQDLKNYCEVSLLVRDGRILSFTAEHAAPEFLYLRDGSNYCGRIFQQCLRRGRPTSPSHRLARWAPPSPP